MKTNALSLKKSMILGLLCAVIIVAGCSKDPATLPENATDPQTTLYKTSVELSPAEIESLLFMVEEEKLAMDVYDFFYEMYGLQIFDRISDSEVKHVAAVSRLFTKYDLENPTDDALPGEFENEELQQLYNELIAMGSVSRLYAIEVGVLIEETDLADIQEYLETVVEAKDLEQVYNNLLLGSEKHLNSFLNEME